MKQPRNHQSGFTIIELLIATAILSVILLIASFVLVAIGRMYTKGTNSAALQNNVRNIVQVLSSSVQYTGTGSIFSDVTAHPTPNPNNLTIKSVCAGNVEISYIVDTLPVDNGNLPTIWQSPPKDAACSPYDLTIPAVTQTPDSTHQNIGLSNEAIHYLTIARATSTGCPTSGAPVGNGLWQICVDAYTAAGNDQILGYNAATPHVLQPTPGNVVCKGKLGEEFCATTDLTTVVTRRLP